jgi:tetratricopeptide (TPR) repeat protein
MTRLSNAKLAHSLQDLSVRLSYMDRREEALEAIQDAVTQARSNGEAPSLPLAGLLHDLSQRLSDLGFREEALETIQQGVVIYYELEEQHIAVPIVDFAMSEGNLSTCLSAVRREEDALEIAQKAVDRLRQASPVDRPTMFDASLASLLSILSTALQSQDLREEALVAIQESVDLHQHLAAKDSMDFIPNLADSLNSLSLCLWGQDRWLYALSAARESVRLYRQMVDSRPAAFTPKLASTLTHFSVCLSFVDDGAALVTIQEAVEIYRRLSADRPTAFNSGLANSLIRLSTCLSRWDRKEEALEAIQDAVQLHRQLSADQPSTFTQDLTRSLDELHICLSVNCQNGHEACEMCCTYIEEIQSTVELFFQLCNLASVINKVPSAFRA